MRLALSLLMLGGFAAALLLVPTGPRAAAGLPTVRLPCAAPPPSAIAPARDWLGSLQGWPDSALVTNWRGLVAISKGRPLPPGC